jgi:hypothetical protein
VEHDRGVGPLTAAGEVVDVVALAVAGVGPHHQDVERLLGAGVDVLLVGPVLQLAGEVLHVEVVVEVAVDVDHPEAGRQTHGE